MQLRPFLRAPFLVLANQRDFLSEGRGGGARKEIIPLQYASCLFLLRILMGER